MLLLDYARAAAIHAPQSDPDAPVDVNRTDFFTSLRRAISAAGVIHATRLADAGHNHGLIISALPLLLAPAPSQSSLRDKIKGS